jgi:hypothetical protein
LPSAFANIRVAADDESVAIRNVVKKDADALGNVNGGSWGEKLWRENPWREMRFERRIAPIRRKARRFSVGKNHRFPVLVQLGGLEPPAS